MYNDIGNHMKIIIISYLTCYDFKTCIVEAEETLIYENVDLCVHDLRELHYTHHALINKLHAKS